jgi:hypothetical protein
MFIFRLGHLPSGWLLLLRRRYAAEQRRRSSLGCFVYCTWKETLYKQFYKLVVAAVVLMSIIWIPCLQAFLTSGDFNLASPREDASPLTSRTMEIVDVNSIWVTWWLAKSDVSLIEGLEPIPPLHAETHHNLQPCKNVEVTERVLSVSLISTYLVKHSAFIFHADVLQYDISDCARMSRVFFTHYKYDANDDLVSMNILQVSPFARLGLSDSYPCRIWCLMLDVKENTRKSMNDARQY